MKCETETDRGHISVEAQADLIAVRGPRSELKLALLCVKRPKPQVEFAVGLEMGGGHPQDRSVVVNHEMGVALGVKTTVNASTGNKNIFLNYTNGKVEYFGSIFSELTHSSFTN